MSVTLEVRNESRYKRLYRSDQLRKCAERVLTGEGLSEDVEISVLFCDDDFIQSLNREYRDMDSPTDVLSFEQEDSTGVKPRPLGDIVISLETVDAHCAGNRRMMREELNLLFCHGLLHLLGYDHQNAKQRNRMQQKQSHYLGTTPEDAWRFGPRDVSPESDAARRRRNTSLGR